MEVWVTILSTLLAGIGVFFGQSGERSNVTWIGYAILVAIGIVGAVSVAVNVTSTRAQDELRAFQEQELSKANTQIAIQSMSLDRPFSRIVLDLSVLGLGDTGWCKNKEQPCYGKPKFEEVSGIPFLPKQENGDVVATIAVDLGETVSASFKIIQREIGLEIEQRVGSGEPSSIEVFDADGTACRTLRAAFDEMGNRPVLAKEDVVKCRNDLLLRVSDVIGMAGFFIDVNSEASARRIISDVLGGGKLVTMEIPNAFDKWGWYHLIQRSRIKRVWANSIHAEITLVQSEANRSLSFDCNTTYAMALYPAEDKKAGDIRDRIKSLFGYQQSPKSIAADFFPKGSLDVTLCRQPY